MNPEDIKVNETYNVLVKVKKNALAENDEFFAVAVDSSGTELNGDGAFFSYSELHAFSPITPSEPPTLVGPAPKHAPCRLFKKGDKVRLIAHRGRIAYDDGLQYPPSATVFIVEHDELKNGIVSIYEQPECDFDAFDIHFSFLELVTPVEELEPYVICENDASYEVRLHSKKENHTMAIYNKNAYGDWLKARYAAEAECARLNEEYRKELN